MTLEELCRSVAMPEAVTERLLEILLFPFTERSL